MAQGTNVVVLGGNLTSDPELRALPSGTSLCKLRVANNRRRKVDGEWTDVVGYFDVTVWGGQAENCAQYLSKGSGVHVTGELRWREWATDSGDKRQAVEINANEVVFGARGDEAPRQQAQQRTDVPAPEVEYPAATASSPVAGAGVPVDDDIPF